MNNELENAVLKTIDKYQKIINLFEKNSINFNNVYDYISLVKIRLYLINVYYSYKGLLSFKDMMSNPNIKRSVNLLAETIVVLYTKFKENKELYTFQSIELENSYDNTCELMLSMVYELQDYDILQLESIKEEAINKEKDDRINELCDECYHLVLTCHKMITNMKIDITEKLNDVVLLEKTEVVFYCLYEFFIGLYHVASRYKELLNDNEYLNNLAISVKSFLETVTWIEEKYQNKHIICEYRTTENLIDIIYSYSLTMEDLLEKKLLKYYYNRNTKM